MRYFEKVSEQIEEIWTSPINTILSAPARASMKHILGDRETGVRNAGYIRPKTRKEITRLAKQIPDVQIYLGNTPMFKRLGRLYSDKGIWGEDTGIFRKILYTPIIGLQSLGMKLIGGDHYDPITKSIVIKSNIPSVAAHEIGHAIRINTPSKMHNVLKNRLDEEYLASRFALDNVRASNKEKNRLTSALVTYIAGDSQYAKAPKYLTFKERIDNELKSL